MNIQYIGDGFVIDCQAHSITIEERRFDVRPKTFQLLLALVEQKDKIIDKQSLLNDIWNDVNVDEQVIFQSIGEIRKIFAGKKVIQTHPRKGYSWVESIEKSTDINTSKNSGLTVTDDLLVQPIEDVNRAFKLKQIIIALLLLITIIASLVYVVSEYKKDKNLTKNTIFILPTKNKIQDKKFDWVSIGIMDTLITQANDHSKVMPLDYVLLSMRNVNMDRNYTAEQIARLFKITAAGLVVESEISRTLDQYQLIYKLHFPNKVVREVIFSDSVDSLVTELAKSIAEITDYKIENTSVNASKFNHELFVEAIGLSQSGNLDAGIQLLKGLIAIEPNNIAAYKVLIDWLQYKADYQAALEVSKKLIVNIENSGIEKAGIYYRHAYSLYRLGKLEEAWVYSTLINQQLKIENNPYYQGFSLQLEGELQLAQNDLNEARKSFLQSLKQFESIYFSIGMTSVHCLLAYTENKAGNTKKSLQHIELAKKVVREYEIENLLPQFKINLKL